MPSTVSCFPKMPSIVILVKSEKLAEILQIHQNPVKSSKIRRTLFSDTMLSAKEIFSDEFRLVEIRKKKKQKTKQKQKQKACEILPESSQILPDSYEISPESLLMVRRNHC
jgi:hypothetical protein